MDKVSQERIQLLHPKVRQEISDTITELQNHFGAEKIIRIAQGLRTIKEQDDLYAQGRTKPGKKVTNAKGGSSLHNYGLAIDFCFIINGLAVWTTNEDWKYIVDTFKAKGWESGADWTSIKDYPHLQKTFGNSWQDLYNKYQKKDFIQGTEYVNI